MSLTLFSGLAELKLTDVEYSAFKIKVRKLLTENLKERLPLEEQDEQFNKLMEMLIEFNPLKSSKIYRASHRDGLNKLSETMLKLLPVLESPVNNIDPIELKINLATYDQPRFKLFKLPISERGNTHFLKAFKAFILEYYEDNPPFKYYKGLEPKLSLDFFEKAKKHPRRVDHPTINKLNDRFIFDLHLTILQLIRSFQQFKSSKQVNNGLSNKEGRFILQFLSLLNYNDFYDNLTAHRKSVRPLQITIKSIKSDFNPEDIKTLRNNLSLYAAARNSFWLKNPKSVNPHFSQCPL